MMMAPSRKPFVGRGKGKFLPAIARLLGSCLFLPLVACDGQKADEPTVVASNAALAEVAPERAPSNASKAPSELAKVEAKALIESCRQVCDNTTSLGCSSHSRCPDACVQSFAVPYCRAEMVNFLKCTQAADVQNFECSPDGFAAIKDGVCDKEQAQVVACLERIEAQ